MTTRKAELDIILKTFNKTDWKDRKTLPNQRGVYLFIEGSMVLYVGLTQCLKKRMSSHTTIADDWVGRNFSIYWDSDYTYLRLTELEVEYIRLFEPPLNRNYRKVSWANKAAKLDEELAQAKEYEVIKLAQAREVEANILIQAWVNDRYTPPTLDEVAWAWEKLSGKILKPEELICLMERLGL